MAARVGTVGLMENGCLGWSGRLGFWAEVRGTRFGVFVYEKPCPSQFLYNKQFIIFRECNERVQREDAVEQLPCLCPSWVLCRIPRKAQACFFVKVTCREP